MWWQVVCWYNVPSLHHTSWCQLEFPLRERGGYTSSKKGNANYYIEHNAEAGERYFVLQQDGAPAHGAMQTQEWLDEHCPAFIDKDSWPSNSPDLYLLDYCMWGAQFSRNSTS